MGDVRRLRASVSDSSVTCSATSALSSACLTRTHSPDGSGTKSFARNTTTMASLVVRLTNTSAEEVMAPAEVERATKEGWTPLYVAAQMGYLKIVKCLVEKGKEDVGKTENDRCTPLEAARSNLRDQMSAQMSSQIVECLKEKGAKE